MYEMKEEYYIGIEMIDNEHKKLFEIAEETYQISRNEFLVDKYDQVRYVLNQLKDYTLMHFDHEEEYMQSIGYNKIFFQKVQHDAFRQKVEEWDIDSIDENSDALIDEILDFLTSWLVDHIFEHDIQIAEALPKE